MVGHTEGLWPRIVSDGVNTSLAHCVSGSGGGGGVFGHSEEGFWLRIVLSVSAQTVHCDVTAWPALQRTHN